MIAAAPRARPQAGQNMLGTYSAQVVRTPEVQQNIRPSRRGHP
jgi:hypothetical protein